MIVTFFIYLTDTTDLNDGAHQYVEGTNKVGGKNKNILKHGYVRINDQDIYNFYDAKKIKTILGKKGTIFVGDTSCFHRGYPPKRNDRLLLVMEYSNSMFGSRFDKIINEDYSKFTTRLNTRQKIINK